MTVGCDYLAIDYHLSYYRVACRQLTEGIENPKEFARVESIRDAALCAIALEIGIVTEIGSGKLDRHLWEKATDFIHRYDPSPLALSDEQIAHLSNEDDPKLLPCGCSENISKYDCKRFGCLRETL